MVKSILMPTSGERTKIGTILQWIKKQGEKFQKGDQLFVVETAKEVMEVEAPESGTLLRVLAKEGTAVMAGGAVALYAAEGEEIPPDLLKPPLPASVTIRLLDERDAFVRDASVRIDGGYLTATPKGEFVIGAIFPGTYTIRVKASGFAEKSLTITLHEGEIFREDLKLISLKKA